MQPDDISLSKLSCKLKAEEFQSTIEETSVILKGVILSKTEHKQAEQKLHYAASNIMAPVFLFSKVHFAEYRLPCRAGGWGGLARIQNNQALK